MCRSIFCLALLLALIAPILAEGNEPSKDDDTTKKDGAKNDDATKKEDAKDGEDVKERSALEKIYDEWVSARELMYKQAAPTPTPTSKKSQELLAQIDKSEPQFVYEKQLQAFRKATEKDKKYLDAVQAQAEISLRENKLMFSFYNAVDALSFSEIEAIVDVNMRTEALYPFVRAGIPWPIESLKSRYSYVLKEKPTSIYAHIARGRASADLMFWDLRELVVQDKVSAINIKEIADRYLADLSGIELLYHYHTLALEWEKHNFPKEAGECHTMVMNIIEEQKGERLSLFWEGLDSKVRARLGTSIGKFDAEYWVGGKALAYDKKCEYEYFVVRFVALHENYDDVDMRGGPDFVNDRIGKVFVTRPLKTLPKKWQNNANEQFTTDGWAEDLTPKKFKEALKSVHKIRQYPLPVMVAKPEFIEACDAHDLTRIIVCDREGKIVFIPRVDFRLDPLRLQVRDWLIAQFKRLDAEKEKD